MIDVTSSSISYTGDGSAVVFTFDFPFSDPSQIVARVNSPETPPATETVLTRGIDYVVSAMGGGGTITTTVPVPAGWNIKIKRWVQPVQLATYQNLGSFPAAAHEAALDGLTEQVQQILDSGGGNDPWAYDPVPGASGSIPAGSVTPAQLNLTSAAPLPARVPIIDNVLTYGFGNTAVAAALITNYPNNADSNRGTGTDAAGVMGTFTLGNDKINAYTSRDAVTVYHEANAPARFGECGTDATYTATTVTSGAWTVSLSRVLVGMLIDTKHSTKLTGVVQSVNQATGTITVDKWRLSGGTTNPDQTGTPANGTGSILNPITKVWAETSNVFLYSASDQATINATLHEYGLWNQSPYAANNPTGVDIVNLGTDFTTGGLLANFYGGGDALLVRGVWNSGVTVYGTANFGFNVFADSNLSGSKPAKAFWDSSNSVTCFGASGGTHTNFLQFSDATTPTPVVKATLDFSGNLVLAGTGTAPGMAIQNGAANAFLTFRNGDSSTYEWQIFEGDTTHLTLSHKAVINAAQPGVTFRETSLNGNPAVLSGFGVAAPQATVHVGGNGILCDAPIQIDGAGQTNGAPSASSNIGLIMVDVTNNKIYVNCTGGWKSASLT